MGNKTLEMLETLASEVANGSRGRFMCPECQGGSSNERSLTIDKEGIRAHCRCWRASCGLGYKQVMTDGSTYSAPTTSRPTKPTRYDGETRYLETGEEINMDFPAEHIPLKLTDDGRVVIPIYDQWNNKRGEVVRQCKPYNSWHPKAMSYYDVDYDGMSWFTACAVDNPPKVPVVCLVEDQLSAARLSTHGVTGVALLGTRLTTDRVRTMRRWVAAKALDDPQRRSPPVYFALDADAYLEAVKQARFLYNQLDIRVLRLFHDVKDMEDEELANFLRVLSV